MTSPTPNSSSSPALHPLSGASVLLAGASGGLGSALAAELDRRGASLTMVARRAEGLDAVPVSGHRLPLDLRLPGAAEQAVEAAVGHTGSLDVVINAVGVVAFGPVADLSVDVMEELFLTNTFLPMLLARASLDRLSEGGALVNLSGVVAETAFGGMAAYGASKAALRSFDEALAKEVRRAGLRIIDARPPHTETGLADRPLAGTAPRMPRGLEPEQVATVVCDGLEAGVDELPSTAFGSPRS